MDYVSLLIRVVMANSMLSVEVGTCKGYCTGPFYTQPAGRTHSGEDP
jgi:hypothetical protein